MKAVQIEEFGGAENLYISDVDKPVINPDEVLIKVMASALNRADILQREGKYPPPLGESEILGLEAAGEVVAKGVDVPDIQIGDRVMALLAGGGQAQYVTANHLLCMPIPEHMSFDMATAIPEVFLTAFQTLFNIGGLKKGEKVLIHAGASGVGTAAIQLAKLMECEVFITATEPKHKACYALGADHCIDYKQENFAEVILSQTSGKGVDIILDFVAAPYFKQNIKSLAIDGRLIMIALMGGVKVADVNLSSLLAKRISIHGTTLRSRSLLYKQQLINDFKEMFYYKFENKSLKPIIDSVYHWDEIRKAHAYMESNKNIGKIIINGMWTE